jgi:signal transduction histidine kinase
VAITATGLYLIRANRRLFGEMASLSEGRRELAQQLIATRESTLRHLSRELHDELGQLLTAMGTMLGRAQKQIPADSPLQSDIREIADMAQHSLSNVRSLSQSLHPSILDELGLESTLDWYLPSVQRQLGVSVEYERSGAPIPIDPTVGIHVYRIVQEALSNVARHAGATRAWVRLRYLRDPGRGRWLDVEIEDHGVGVPDPGRTRRGLGLVAMRERAELVGGHLEIGRSDQGGTRVRLRVPLEGDDVETAADPALAPQGGVRGR